MCNEAVDNYAHELKFVPDCCKAQKRCDKPLNTYASTVQFIRECYKAQEMCGKAVNRCFFVFDSIPDRYKPQERYELFTKMLLCCYIACIDIKLSMMCWIKKIVLKIIY